MKSLPLLPLAILSLTTLAEGNLRSLKLQGPPPPVYSIISNAGAVLITVDNVTVGTTGSKLFDIEVKDYDLAQLGSGAYASMLNTTGTLVGAPSSGTMPLGVSIQFATDLGENFYFKNRMKVVTVNAAAQTLIYTWTFTDDYEMCPPNDGSTTKTQLITIS